MEDPNNLDPDGTFPTTLPRSGRLELVARDLTRNINRRYAIEHCVDLFGGHLVETSWGRCGTWGQSKRHSFDDPADAERAVRNHLRRRARAPRRIGVGYRVVGEDS
ncbi:WGR domain-containing protein [Polymorphobacter multimanifer]|nr:WGR domain-containing protein [Polymorphobacter multimanifer]